MVYFEPTDAGAAGVAGFATGAGAFCANRFAITANCASVNFEVAFSILVK